MKTCKIQFKILLVLFLATICASQSVYTYTFPTAATSTYQIPSYPLGQLNRGDNLTLVIQLPKGGAMLMSSYLILSIMDATNTNTIVTFDDSNPSRCNGGTICTLSWTVTATANYYLKVYSANPNTELNSLAMYYLLASANNVAILRVTDVLRQHIIKYFYVSFFETITATLSPFGNLGQNYLTLLKMSPTSSSGFNVLSSSDLTPYSVSGNVGTFIQNLQPGYYAFIVHTNSASSVTITTQSDPYPCPYINTFTDYFAVFSGCTRSGSTTAPPGSGLPCIVYDYNSQACLQCMSGYGVSQGSCVLSTNCGPREYSKFGSCYLVSSTCDQFDPYTGNCLSCVSSQYQLINGQCIYNTNFCLPGYFLVNSFCVSTLCGTYNQSTGKCLSCLTAAYYLSSGQCLPVDCGSGKYFSVNSSSCTSIPPTCANFSITYEVCYSCISGYTMFNGVCTVYSNTNNCQIYNYAANVCSTCNSGYFVYNGACIKNTDTVCAIGQILSNGICVINPNNCNQNQVVVNSQCVDLPNKCLSLNSYFQCTNCANNYQLVSGICQACSGTNPNFPCMTCPNGMYVDNQGRCQQVNQFCASYNNANGLCLTCTNGQQPVYGNCCNNGYVYQNGGCVVQQSTGNSGGNSEGNNGGSGNSGNSGSSGSSGGRSSYGPYCQSINPSLRICLSCLQGHYFDQTGYCI